MSDQKNTDHWQSLASQIGAEVPPEQGASNQPTSQAEPGARDEGAGESPARRAKPDRRPKAARPARPRADWMGLAEQLGVAPSEAQEVLPSETSAESSAAAASQETAVWPSASPEPQDWLMRDALIDTFEGDATREAGPQRAETGDSREPARADDERLPRRRKKRRRRGRESKGTDGRSDETKKAESTDVAPARAAAETSETLETSDTSETEAAPESSRHASGPRTSKRRRRGRGDRKRSATGGPASGDASKALSDDASVATPAAEDEDLDRDEGESLTPEDDDASSSSAAGFAHRGIPTWEEAVGVVIAANLESRSKRGAGDSSSPSRRGRGRGGRDRGGRDRGGPKRPRSN